MDDRRHNNQHHSPSSKGGGGSYPPSEFSRPGGGGPGGPGSVVSSGHQSQHLPPGQTMVTMNTDPTPGARVTEINLNLGYFMTLPGILKLIQLVFGIICMATGAPARGLKGSGYGLGHNHWFLFVVVTTFIITLLWSFYYLLQMRDSMKFNMPCSWLCLEYYYTIVATICYIIAFIVMLAGFGYCAGSTWCDARITAGCFGIFNSIAYALGAYILHNDYKATPPELQQ